MLAGSITISFLLFAHIPALQSGEKPSKIVVLGDSITRGVRAGVKPEETFAQLLQASLKKEGIAAEVINVGVGGENTQQALARLEKAVIALKPRLVTIMYGTNDSYIDKGKKESRLTEEEYGANLRRLMDELRKAGIAPVLMTPPPFGDKHPADGAGKHPNRRLEKYVEVCRQVARDTKTPLVDHFQRWSEINAKGTDIGGWMTDECHPNPRGHQEITSALLPLVRAALR